MINIPFIDIRTVFKERRRAGVSMRKHISVKDAQGFSLEDVS